MQVGACDRLCAAAAAAAAANSANEARSNALCHCSEMWHLGVCTLQRYGRLSAHDVHPAEIVNGMVVHPLAREPAHYGPVRSIAAAVSAAPRVHPSCVTPAQAAGCVGMLARLACEAGLCCRRRGGVHDIPVLTCQLRCASRFACRAEAACARLFTHLVRRGAACGPAAAPPPLLPSKSGRSRACCWAASRCA